MSLKISRQSNFLPITFLRLFLKDPSSAFLISKVLTYLYFPSFFITSFALKQKIVAKKQIRISKTRFLLIFSIFQLFLSINNNFSE